jgi:peptidyl-prolyl cis-trans isomerase SurA
MLKRILLTVFTTLLFLFNQSVSASGEPLMVIGGRPVSVEEFNYIYKKNNINNSANYSRQSLEEYLQLFINYKLKVRQAEDMGMDTLNDLVSEYKGYEQQLYESHINKTIVDPLVQQEYARSKFDIGVSHIFISKNTPEAEKKIKEVHAQLKKGLPFEKLAAEFSEDQNSAAQGGKIGYFTALQIGYPQLEDAVYNTPVGQYSSPVETAIGYHIIKVFDKRPARGRIKVAIIKRSLTEDPDQQAKTAALVDSLYKLAISGADFGDLATRFSEDQLTNLRAGEMDWFGINQYTQVFEDAAFALKKDGEISKPVKTPSAYYIIKRLMITLEQPLTEAEPVLKTKILKSRMYSEAMNKLMSEVKTKYGYKEYPEGLEAFKIRMDTYVNKFPFKYSEEEKPGTLLEIDGKKISANDFGRVMNTVANKVIGKSGQERTDAIFEETLKQVILDAHKNNLPKENAEYKALLEEYRNGVLIFELTRDKVWNKAVMDSAGLAGFFESHRDKYLWKERLLVRKYNVRDEAGFQKLKVLIKDNPELSINDYGKLLEQNELQVSDVQELTLEKGIAEEAAQLNWEKGSVQLIKKNNQLSAYHVLDVLPAGRKEYSECKGYVIADFQEFLEKNWMTELRNKYPVEVNKAVFEKLVMK